MIKRFVLGIVLVATPLAALQAMNVAVFLQKADALEKKGMRALFASDYKLLKNEVVTDSQALRVERLAAERAGRHGAYCPPKKSGLSSGEILAAFRSIPAGQRAGIDVKDALRALLARKYPCR
jgi:hypothetical protein